MDKIKTLSKVGIGLAVVDFLLRGFGPLYTTEVQNALNASRLIFVAIIPVIAILASFSLLKGKKFGLYLAIVLTLLSLTSFLLTFGEEFTILGLLYLLIYGLLSFWGLQQSKNLR